MTDTTGLRAWMCSLWFVLALVSGCASSDRQPVAASADGDPHVLDKSTKKPVTTFTITPLVHAPDARDSQWRAGAPLAVQNKQGRFSVPRDSGSTAFRVDAAGYLPAFVALPQQTGVPLEVMLDRGASVVGRVLSPAGAALPGVDVRYELNVAAFPELRHQQTVTDGNGQYGATVNPGDQTFQFSKDGFIAEEKHPKIAGSGETRLDVTLTPVQSVVGTIVDDTGAAVGRVRVRAKWSDKREMREAMTDDAGRFELKPIRPGVHTFELSKGGYPVTAIPSVTVPNEALKLVLPRGAIVTGTVTGATAAERPFVFIYFENGMMTGINAEGRFGLPGVPAGHTTVHAEIADVGRVKRSAAKEIVLDNGGKTDVALELSERTNVHGVVREGDKPVSRVVIALTPAGGGSSTRVVTDENGQYQVLGLTAGPYRIVTEGRPLLSSADVAVQGETKLDISVGPAPSKSPDRPPGF